ncbi:MAG: NAD-dependent protein deacylase [Bacteroidales bacterium]|nr:NAD-dependent protein deacylase [Bacteroidales bacterium]
MENLTKAADKIKNSAYLSCFTGAGISIESGIPVFRGADGLYSKFDQSLLEISSYQYNTSKSWKAIKKVFYDSFINAKPNLAHKILSKWETNGLLKSVTTQNIDNLHRQAGSKNVIEYHGNKEYFVCFDCEERYANEELKLTQDPPKCLKCGGLLKPDFIFFGEPIPTNAANQSYKEAKKSDVHLIIGTTGTVQPAAYIPYYAKKAGALIIEINPDVSSFTTTLSDIFIKMKASEAMQKLDKIIFS